MADFPILSTRGGLNNTDSPSAVGEDQIVDGENVEWRSSSCGERRRGAEAVTMSDFGALEDQDRITFLHRHLPTDNPAESELWALGVLAEASATLVKVGDSAATVTPIDAIDATIPAQYEMDGQTLHGKLFLAYKSAEDRLHVYDGSTLRRAGLAAPGVPTVADTGDAGGYATLRYFRVRAVVISGSTVTRRSEPSAEVAFVPNGAFDGAVITKPVSMPGEGETHWEIEASVDNIDYYVLAQVAVATGTYEDNTAFDDGYTSGDLSDTIGEYTVPHSARYLGADEDRLLMLGSHEDPTKSSRFSWTPVYGDLTGVSNDERIPLESVNFLDLDGFEGGPGTGLSGQVNGYTYAFKQSHIYKLVRTGIRRRAYDHFPISKSRGAIEGSIGTGLDEMGRACVLFADPAVGPCLIGANGLQTCGTDILTTWARVNLDATIVCRNVYYPTARQWHLWLALDGADTPNERYVLHTNEMEFTKKGYRRGWIPWTGPSSEIYAVTLYASNLADIGDPRNQSLVPVIGKDTAL